MFANFFKKKDASDLGTDEKYLEFRNIILELDPKKFELSEQIPDTWGVMIDMGIPQLRFTIATLIDGTTSVYAGEGGARLGFGQHPKIAKMSKDLLSVASNPAIELKLTNEFPLPELGMVRFYIFRKDGKYMAECPLDDVKRDRSMEDIIKSQDWLALMFRIGWTIINEMRVIKAQS